MVVHTGMPLSLLRARGALVLCIMIAAAGAAGAAETAIDIPHEAVTRKVLDNGLSILAKHSSPENLVAVDVKIMAGGSTEDDYLGSGISHLVEHMIFKGTGTRGPGDIEREIKSYGGVMNGSVSQDVTDYRIILPSKYLREALAVLADMLLSAIFDPAELAREKEVVLKEIKLNRDEPQSMLIRLLNETAYTRHPYKYPTIGYEEPFRALTRDDLIRYYNRMYVPNRITVTVVGGVDEAIAVAAVRDAFKMFRSPSYAPAGLRQAEPPQIAPRAADEETATMLAYLAVGFHSTSLLSDDLYAMDVLAMILGRGDNSRLTTSLVKDNRMAYNISCWNYTPVDPGLLVITAILGPANLAAAQIMINDEIGKIKSGSVSDAELEAANRMVVADYISALQTVDGQANDIASSYILTGNYDFSRRYILGVQSVTKEDVQRVANKYLGEDNATTVRILPAGSEDRRAAKPAAVTKDEIRKATLPNGLRILVHENHATPSVSITAAMLGGLMAETPRNNGISSFTADMLVKGTRSRDESKIKGLIQQLGGDMSTFSGFNAFGVTVDLLTPDLDAGLDILRDVLANSTFPQTEIDKDKTLAIASIQKEDDDIFQSGINRLRAKLFEGSPYAMRYIGERETVEALTRDDIAAFARNHCAAGNTVIAVSGDVNADSLINKLKAKFSDLRQQPPPQFAPRAVKLDKARRDRAQMDKEESLVLVGYLTTTVRDPDRYALEVLSSILSGASGRLFDGLRNKMGLAYTLGCLQKLAIDTGFFAFYVATTKDKIEVTKRALAAEVQKIRQQPVPDAELATAKRELISERRIAQQTNEFYAMTSALDELYGLGGDNLYRYESGIEKVTAGDVQRVAQKYLDPNASAEVIISSK